MVVVVVVGIMLIMVMKMGCQLLKLYYIVVFYFIYIIANYLYKLASIASHILYYQKQNNIWLYLKCAAIHGNRRSSKNKYLLSKTIYIKPENRKQK